MDAIQPSATDLAAMRGIAWTAAREAAGHGEVSASFHGFKLLAKRRTRTVRPRARPCAQVEIWIAYQGELIEHQITEMEITP